MRPIAVGLVLALGCGFAFLLGMNLAPAPSSMVASLEEDAAAGGLVQRPVLVELFTSQGCSSCPPADALLEEMAADPFRQVIPLSFHVDYWNRLGWRDPFSDARWSERQRRYNQMMRTGRVYTPQLVIDGADHCVGSDLGTIHRLLDEAARRPAGAELDLTVTPEGQGLQVAVEAAMAVAQSSGSEARVQSMAKMEIYVALAETGLKTSVKSGENARRDLSNDFVVRRLEKLSELDLEHPRALASLELDLSGVEKRQNVWVVVFAQEPESLQVRGAAAWKDRS